MSACQALIDGATAGVAASLKAVDCVSAEATTTAFSRLFGTQGALLPALTLMLTLYIAVFALLLLTGRASLSIGALAPRMMTIGLVLTFTTSSVAYQGVVWNLAVGAPDQIAGVLMGVKGSASQLFADRIDILFNAIAETAAAAGQGTPKPAPGSFTPSDLMWISALMLMLGTVGVLVTARIILAILLSLGPIFITLVLFNGTRGLFAGWLRGVTLTAFTPLIAALAGASVVEFAVPLVAALRAEDGGIDGRAAMALFVVAAIYCAIMIVAIRVAATMVAGWRVFGLAGGEGKRARPEAGPAPAMHSVAVTAASAFTAPSGRRSLTPAAAPAGAVQPVVAVSAAPAAIRNIVIPATASGGRRPSNPSRARGIGSRFAGRVAPRGALLR